MSPALRIGFVPEHFSTPLHFAQKYFALDASLVPFPSGTGHMISALRANEIDIGIGLTEGWIAGLAQEGGYQLVGTYVETPLCWAISTGAQRRDLNGVEKLRGAKCGVSRVGSGSYVMSFVLADSKGWLEGSRSPGAAAAMTPPFEIVPLQTFAALWDAVNDGSADMFMWEYFTTKRYYDSGVVKQLGAISTPWSSWKIVARDAKDARLDAMFESLDAGVRYFETHQEEAVGYISSSLDYSEEDARAWLGTVRFAKGVKGVMPEVVERTLEVLGKAGVVEGKVDAGGMIGIARV